jgi:hypothetical protein
MVSSAPLKPSWLRTVLWRLGFGRVRPRPGVEFRTKKLSESEIHSFDEVLRREFPLAGTGYGTADLETWHGEVHLPRPADGSPERERLRAWLQSRPEVIWAEATKVR